MQSDNSNLTSNPQASSSPEGQLSSTAPELDNKGNGADIAGANSIDSSAANGPADKALIYADSSCTVESAKGEGNSFASSGAFNFEEARRFLTVLDPGATGHTFQTFDDNKERLAAEKAAQKARGEKPRDSRAKVLNGELDRLARGLERRNDDRAGVFVTVNETDLQGREGANIKRFRCVFCECDNPEGKPLEGLLAAFPIPPSIVVESSPGRYHFYWLIGGEWLCDSEGVALWRAVMARMVQDYGSDANAADPTRVLRLPGFYHCKGEPFLVRIIGGNEKRYSVEEIVAAFPPILEAKKPKTAPDNESAGSAKGARAYSRRLECEIRSALEAIKRKVSDYEAWFEIGLAIYRLGWNDKGYRVWADWSQAFPEYYEGNEEVCREKWDKDIANAADRGDGNIVIHSVFKMAQDEGWTNPSSGKGKLSDKVIDIALDHAEFFHSVSSNETKACALINEPGTRLVLEIGTTGFKEWLDHITYKQAGQMYGKDARKEAIEGLLAHAKFDCDCRDVYLRTAHISGETYIDLGAKDGRVIKVNAEDWKEEACASVHFVRSNVTMPLCIPERGGNVMQLREFISCADEDFILIVAWLVSCLAGIGPFPILMLHAQAGSGKTFVEWCLSALIDPRKALTHMPEDVRSLMVAAKSRYLLGFDNISVMSYKIADALCQIATGGGYEGRANYTDDELHVIDVMRPIMLNGIPELAERNDLLERSLMIELQPISEDKRRDPVEIKKAFEKARPQILGALLDALSYAMKELPTVKLDKMPRMAGFARLGTAVTPFYSKLDFMPIYQENIGATHESLFEADNVAPLVIQIVSTEKGYHSESVRITPKELYDKLSRQKRIDYNDIKEWPRNPKAMSDHICKRLKDVLKNEGLNVKRMKSNGVRYLEFTPIDTETGTH